MKKFLTLLFASATALSLSAALFENGSFEEVRTIRTAIFLTQKNIFMKMTNNLCSTSCSSYSELPEPGFYLCSIKAGESFVLESDETNHLLFIRKGTFTISSVERSHYQVKASSVLLALSQIYNCCRRGC